MAGTKLGGIQARDTNYVRQGIDFYRRIGAIGGQRSNNGGFASLVIGADGLTGRERARVAGELGGRKSKRRKANWTTT